jgi:hypothetical protein
VAIASLSNPKIDVKVARTVFLYLRRSNRWDASIEAGLRRRQRIEEERRVKAQKARDFHCGMDIGFSSGPSLSEEIDEYLKKHQGSGSARPSAKGEAS